MLERSYWNEVRGTEKYRAIRRRARSTSDASTFMQGSSKLPTSSSRVVCCLGSCSFSSNSEAAAVVLQQTQKHQQQATLKIEGLHVAQSREAHPATEDAVATPGGPTDVASLAERTNMHSPRSNSAENGDSS